MKRRLKIAVGDGARVRVLTSRHNDVPAGTNGEIDGQFEDGFAVKLEVDWKVTGSGSGSVHEFRSMWYPADELEVA